jgi:hypothetical protein
VPKIPHGERAALEIEKLENYCLDLTHPHGRHKARVFRSVLGIDRADAVRTIWVIRTGEDFPRFITCWVL